MNEKLQARHRVMMRLGSVLLLLPLCFYGSFVIRRPPRVNEARSLFQGIEYQRQVRDTPRPLMLHIVSVDLAAPGIRPWVTPADPPPHNLPDDRETNARTVSEFLSEHQLQLAINANFFYPFAEKTPWDYYPVSGDRVNSLGQVISDRHVYSLPQAGWPVLCFGATPSAQILESGTCPVGTHQSVSGSAVLVRDGKLQGIAAGAADSDGRYSRTVVAIDRTGQKLWIISVDDKQFLYSEGMTLAEVGQVAIGLGADAALNLDGGGSTTLVAEIEARPRLLNAPVHTKIPMRERPVANHLGFYALPKR